MAVDDHGLEVLKKAGEQVTPGDKSDYYIKVKDIFGGGGLASTTPKIYNVSVPLANTEVSQALTASTKYFMIKARGSSKLQFAFISTESSTNFITVPAGSSYSESGLSLTGKTIYFQTSKASETVEIMEWS